MKKFWLALLILFTFASVARAQFDAQHTWGGTATGTANAPAIVIQNVTQASDLTGVPLRFIPSAVNTGAATLTVSNGATNIMTAVPILKPYPGGLSPLTGGEMASPIEVWYDGTEFVLNTNSTAIIKINSNLTLFIAPAPTGNDANPCTSSGAPCRTLQHVWNVLVSSYNLNGFTATIQMADGTYGSNLLASTMPAGVPSLTSIVINGNPGTPNNVVISTPNNCVTAQGPVGFVIQNLQMASTNGNELQATAGASISFQNITFGGAPNGNHIAAQFGGSIAAIGNYTVAGSAQYHWNATLTGSIVVNGFTVFGSGAPAFAQAFAGAGGSGAIQAVGDTFSGGTYTGPRYAVTGNASIYTNGASTTYLPGSSPGATNTGGQYYFLLKRDLDPSSNDNTPVFLNKAA